ncbi:MAG TPA: DMT family transporter [Ramlibacter sp.]|nr:DMT family transporter [Ramlibacter sp.]
MSSASPSRGRTFWVGVGCAIGVLLIWTSFILIARVSAKGHLSPFDISFVRFVFSGLIALPVVFLRGGWLLDQLAPNPRLAFKRGAALVATAGIGYCSLAYSGFFFAPVSHAAVLLPGSLPLYTAVFAALLVGERFGRARLIALAAIVAGNLLIGGASLRQAFVGDHTWKGDVLFIGAAMCWALYSVLCRRWHLGAVPATCAIAIGCLATYVPVFALAAAGGLVPTQLANAPWSEIAFQAVYQGGLSMFLAGVAFTQVVKTFGPVRATMITAVVPVLATLLALPLLNETLTAVGGVGLVCVTLGLVIGVRAQAGINRTVLETRAAPPSHATLE